MDMENLVKNTISIIETVAPTIAMAIGGPALSAPAQIAIALLSEAFGVSSADLDHAISNDPEKSKTVLGKLEEDRSPLLKEVMQIKMPTSMVMSVKLNWET